MKTKAGLKKTSKLWEWQWKGNLKALENHEFLWNLNIWKKENWNSFFSIGSTTCIKANMLTCASAYMLHFAKHYWEGGLELHFGGAAFEHASSLWLSPQHR